MEAEAAFRWINDKIIAKTQKSLTDRDKKVFLGIWQGQTYEQIADNNNYTEQRIKEIANDDLFPKIRNLVSNRKINKSNFKTAIEQLFHGELGDSQTFTTDFTTEVRQEEKLINPFTPLTGKIEQARLFFNREQEIKEVFELLNSRSSVSIVGERQIGKSSLLLAIKREAKKQLKQPRESIYLDLQAVNNENDFTSYLCDEVGIKEAKGYQLTRELKKTKLLLLIDEFEKMTYEGFTRGIRSQLRGLAEGENAPLRLVFASRDSLSSLFKDSEEEGMTSPLAGICLEVKLEGWDESTGREFVRSRLLLSEEEVVFSEEEIEKLVRESGGHPQRLMKLCYDLFKGKILL